MRSLSSLSTEYVAYKVTATDYTGAAMSTAGDAVQIAFVAPGVKPATADWHPASWLASGVAGILVGPSGGLVLAVGTYAGWVKVTDSPEVPAIQADLLEIT